MNTAGTPPPNTPLQSPSIGGLAAIQAPVPSARLEAALGELGTVRTRRPRLALAVVAVLSVAWCAALLLGVHLGPRPDLAQVSPVRLALVLLGSGAVFTGFLWSAVVPRRGHVLPWLGPARGAVIAGLAVGLLGVLLAPAAGPRSFVPPPTVAALVRYSRGCARGALMVAIVPTAIALLSLRRSLPLGAARVGARVGVAIGALTAMVMALHCPIVGVAHVGLVHGGEVLFAVAMAAAFGGWLLTD